MTELPPRTAQDIIDQLAPDMTFVRFLATCQPTLVKHGTAVIIPFLDGDLVRMRRVELFKVQFPDKGHVCFIGQDHITGNWYYR